jgi:hypothetical protein
MSNDETSNPVSQEVLKEKLHTMDDNTQINENGVRYAKLAIPAGLIDEVSDHYGFFDIIEANTMAFRILHIFHQIEKDGYQIALIKVEKDDSGKDVAKDIFVLDIHKIIHDVRVKTAEQLTQKKNESV